MNRKVQFLVSMELPEAVSTAGVRRLAEKDLRAGFGPWQPEVRIHTVEPTGEFLNRLVAHADELVGLQKHGIGSNVEAVRLLRDWCIEQTGVAPSLTLLYDLVNIVKDEHREKVG